MKKLSSLVLAIVAMVMLAGAPTAQEPAVLTAAVGNNMNHVPSFVGVEKGIFLKHGVDLKLKVLGTGQEMAKALQAGEVQIIGSAYSSNTQLSQADVQKNHCRRRQRQRHGHTHTHTQQRQSPTRSSVRRGRPRQGRRRDALLRRKAVREGQGREDAADGFFRGRGLRCRQRHRLAGVT